MGLLIDYREKDILPEFRGLDIEYDVVPMEFADCRFTGHGPRGPDTLMFGIERKKLSDLVNCIKDRRLSGRQLEGLCEEHDVVYIFFEANIRPGKFGEIEEYVERKGHDGKWIGWRPFFSGDRRAISYRQVVSYLTTLELKGEELGRGNGWPKVRVRQTNNARTTAEHYVQLYHWANDKPWEDHESHRQVYIKPPTLGEHRVGLGSNSTLRVRQSDLTYAWMFASQVEGLDKKARAAAEYFRSGRRMANAGEWEWRKVPGIGEKLARECVRAWKEEKAGPRRKR